MSLMNNFSFLITFVLFLIMIGLIWYHFNERINEQNNKISQMVRVMTTMTAEVSLIRKKIGLPFPETINLNEQLPCNNNKIYVSDEENVSESDSDSDSESDDSDSDSEFDDSDSDSDNENSKEEKQVNSLEDIDMNIINIIEEDIKENEKEDLEYVKEELEDVIEELEDVKEDLEYVKEEQEEDVREEKEEDVREEKEEDVKEDYKKMSLNKLKTIVLEKKLTTDVAKLKKNDLLTILGVDV